MIHNPNRPALITAQDYIDVLESLDVRAKLTVYHGSGMISIRVVRDVATLLDERLTPYRMAGICVLILGELHWWECWWTRVQFRASHGRP